MLGSVPDGWLEGPSTDDGPDAVRRLYVDQLLARLAARGAWLPGLVEAVRTGGAVRRAPRGENRPSWLGPPPPEGVTQR